MSSPGTHPPETRGFAALSRRRYGAHPLHAVLLGLSLIPAGLALGQLLDERPADVAGWLVGSALIHDGLLLPLYVLADAAVLALWRRYPGPVDWINFVRIPLATSGMLLLMFSPTILRQAESFEARTGRDIDAFLGRWLAITAALLLVSALWYLARLAVVRARGLGR